MRYKELAERCIEDIQSGRIPSGHKLPSLRRFAAQNEVSLTTAQSAYYLLEELGWVSVRPQSGFFASVPPSSNPPPIMPAFTCRTTDPESHNYSFRGLETGPLGVASLSPELLPLDSLERSMRRATREAGASMHGYPVSSGEPLLRSALSAHFASYDLHFSANELVVTNGCMDAVRTAIAITTNPGDAVAISSPCYNGLLNLLALMGRKVVEIPTVENGLDLAQLERYMQQGLVQAGLFSSSHMNPTGVSLNSEQKENLAVLAGKYRVPIVEDDVYLELGFQRSLPMPVRYWDRSGYVLWCGSISKTLSAGYRLGWCLPGRYRKQYERYRFTESFGVNLPVQLAVADFIGTNQYSRHLQGLRQKLAFQVASYRNYLSSNLPDESRISDPHGGMVIWLQIPGLDSRSLCRMASEENIALLGGADFSTLDLYGDCVRVNCGWPLKGKDGGKTEAGFQLERFIELIHSCR
ncbi:transcriptional regulator [Microbulbifer sp. A4B17]|uniref:aminotransferase-like domain-containing protein n=1 Tax=Microbulbifer sp. A4B17 TaxID=359370 RepID=UPI000D52CBEF|nr:PLP-dependent aminotransferase family protein [Microbulbifer sp. A4B17]AWF80966.1 transcriptional regulator [Microbulbifer sp. A4B17]